MSVYTEVALLYGKAQFYNTTNVMKCLSILNNSVKNTSIPAYN